MSDLMARLGAKTRFQAGYQAVVRGWLTLHVEPGNAVKQG